VKSDDEMEVTGKVTEVDNDEDSDVDMTELAAKWSDDGDE
jgi:hypothetical protein